MNGYHVYPRQWFSFAFENPDVVSGNHGIVYLWAVELNNRLGWVKKFGIPSEMAMSAAGIKSYKTYSKIFEDLVRWGFFEVHQRSSNQYTADIIALVNFTEAHTEASAEANTKALTNAILSQQPEQYHGSVGIIIPKDLKTDIPINLETDDDAGRVCEESFSDQQVEEKKETPSKVAPKVSPSLHAQVKGLIESLNPGYYWQAKDGKAAKSLIQKVKHRWQNKHGTEATDENVIESLNWMLSRLPEWYRNKWDTAVIESKFESIVKQITEEQKNGKSGQLNRNDSPSGTGVSSRLQSAWELLAESRKVHASG